MRSSILFVCVLGLVACTPETEPVAESTVTTTPGESGSETMASGESESGDESDGTGTTTADTDTATDTEQETGPADECFSDNDCPGTEICDQPSLYPNSCVSCSECCSKVDCPEGFECWAGSHHSSNGECVAECTELGALCAVGEGECCEGASCVPAGEEDELGLCQVPDECSPPGEVCLIDEDCCEGLSCVLEGDLGSCGMMP